MPIQRISWYLYSLYFSCPYEVFPFLWICLKRLVFCFSFTKFLNFGCLSHSCPIARGKILAHSAPRSFLHTLKICTKHKLLCKGDSNQNSNENVSKKNKIILIQFTHFIAIIWRMCFFQFLLRYITIQSHICETKGLQKYCLGRLGIEGTNNKKFTPSCYMIWYHIHLTLTESKDSRNIALLGWDQNGI